MHSPDNGQTYLKTEFGKFVTLRNATMNDTYDHFGIVFPWENFLNV